MDLLDIKMERHSQLQKCGLYSEQLYRFVANNNYNFKAQGQLDSADAAAAKVLACLDAEDFGQKVIADVRELAQS